MNLPTPPAELEPLASRLGAWGLFKLIDAHGGLRLYIPRRPRDTDDLGALLGMEAVEKLAAEWGGDYLKVPLARAWFARCLEAQGLSQRRIARHMRTTENTVRLLLQGLAPGADTPRRDPRQAGLPL
jgi:hypothetical protein